MPPALALPIIDADGHVVDPDSTWTHCLTPRHPRLRPATAAPRRAFPFPCGLGRGIPDARPIEEQQARLLFQNAQRFYPL